MKKIPLFYWSSVKFENKPKENYGDLLSKYIVEKISAEKVKWVHPKKQPWYRLDKTNYLGIGSILAHASKNSIVWGSGIIDQKHSIEKADFRAVRGPKTRDRILALGYNCAEVYGDPALLLPKFYNPTVEKEFQTGIIPHYVDYDHVIALAKQNANLKVIDMLTDDIEQTTREILSCKRIVSSSLHGLIVAHAYGIPAIWAKFSDKIFGDGIKYQDYFLSVGLGENKPLTIDFHELNSDKYIDKCLVVQQQKIKSIQDILIQNCPF
ncbi:polysaccharide pyruvyl transferase family protein [Zunongwangia profunda]|jgi:hypothetical protein|uniref:polysaccharide pyruvyl transferase family protein n=1 Tax=Zunongwangia profunda TaxID=398743 RepID=UPI001D18AA8E|nr:polysaccharide pyruvyl transferase family protein [Zunongwangia profunda]MCC4230156.1 polysaccharide pyruvyl transferase family protein [Zunongwangia profunda]|tara:strand:+ start:202 stop:999 length:798 start_codon:yes stop_codon:yes gene_type:complete